MRPLGKPHGSGRHVGRSPPGRLRISAEVLHRWIATTPGITMPVHQLPFVVFPAVDLRDAEVERLDRAAAEGAPNRRELPTCLRQAPGQPPRLAWVTWPHSDSP
jgi:hypothetical protein